MMLDRMKKILAILAFLLGIAHIIFGFVVFKVFTLETFWFLGFGLAIIMTALANFQQDKVWILRAQNALMLGFIVALLFLAAQPQVLIGCILFAGLFLISCSKSTHQV